SPTVDVAHPPSGVPPGSNDQLTVTLPLYQPPPQPPPLHAGTGALSASAELARPPLRAASAAIAYVSRSGLTRAWPGHAPRRRARGCRTPRRRGAAPPRRAATRSFLRRAVRARASRRAGRTGARRAA